MKFLTAILRFLVAGPLEPVKNLECLWCHKLFKREELLDDSRYCASCYDEHIIKRCQDCGTSYRFDQMAEQDKRFCRWCFEEQNPFQDNNTHGSAT